MVFDADNMKRRKNIYKFQAKNKLLTTFAQKMKFCGEDLKWNVVQNVLGKSVDAG